MLEATRTLDQNARLWSYLTDLAEQLKWPVDGEEQYLTKEDWKIIMTAGLKREQRIAKGAWGGFVMLGTSTSKMKKAEISDLMALVEAFGAEHGVTFHDPNVVPLEAYR